MYVGKHSIAALAAALGATCVLAPAAQAQDSGIRNDVVITAGFDRTDVAGMRSEPQLTPRPLQVGSFRLDASLSTIAAYETNVLRRRNPEGDASLSIVPQVRLSNTVDNFGVQVGASGLIRRYVSMARENLEEGVVDAAVSTRLGQDSSLRLTGSYGREAETRGISAVTDNAAEPVTFTTLATGLRADFSFGALRLSPSANYLERSYSALQLEDGTTLDQSFRDTRNYGGGLAIGYELSPLLVTFVEGGFTKVESTDPLPNLRRDSERLTLTAGVRGEVTPLVIAEVHAGYRQTNYDLARFRDVSGATFGANVQWFATPLMSFRLVAVQEPINSGRADVAGILSSRIAASAFYDPLRNLRLSTTVSFAYNDYRDVDTVAKRAGLKMQAQYMLGPQMSVGAFFDVIRQNVSGTQLVTPSTALTAGLGFTVTP